MQEELTEINKGYYCVWVIQLKDALLNKKCVYFHWRLVNQGSPLDDIEYLCNWFYDFREKSVQFGNGVNDSTLIH